MTTLMFYCRPCNRGREVACRAVSMYRGEDGYWIAHCTCPDCGATTLLRVNDGDASAVLYWQQVDRANADAIRRCRAYAGDLDDEDLCALGDEMVWHIEEYLRGCVDG